MTVLLTISGCASGRPTAITPKQAPAAVPVLTDLGSLGGEAVPYLRTDHPQAVAVSGNVVVGNSPNAGNEARAFAYDMGAASPTMRDLGSFGGSASVGTKPIGSTATAVSGKIVVGESYVGSGTVDMSVAKPHAFAYDLGAASPKMRDLGTLGGPDSYASAVSGQIVVGGSTVASPAVHAFAYDLGANSPRMLDLGTLGGQNSHAAAVSGNIVVGYSAAAGDPMERDSPGHAFVYDIGAPSPKMHEIGGFRSSATAVSGRVVVGAFQSGSGEQHAFAYDLSARSPKIRDLGALAGGYSGATAVSGDIVVGNANTASGDHAFAYDLGARSPKMLDLGTLGGRESYATGVSGTIVVGESSTSDGVHAFYYDLAAPSPVMHDLGTLGGSDSSASAVSGNIVVGMASSPDGIGHPVAWDLAKPASPPDAPTGLSGQAGDSSVTVSWSAPANSGGRPITSYRVTPYIGGVAQTPVTFNSAATTQRITGLAHRAGYTFTVVAINASGTGPPSSPSPPLAPT